MGSTAPQPVNTFGALEVSSSSSQAPMDNPLVIPIERVAAAAQCLLNVSRFR